MRVYICPICFATLERSAVKGKGRCPDCRYDWFLYKCQIVERDEGVLRSIRWMEAKT